MPLGGLRTFTNMGDNGGMREGDDWKEFKGRDDRARFQW